MVEPLAPLLDALRPLLRRHRTRAAYVVGSWARDEADAWSDVDLVIVAPSPRAFVVHALQGAKLVYDGWRRGGSALRPVRTARAQLCPDLSSGCGDLVGAGEARGCR